MRYFALIILVLAVAGCQQIPQTDPTAGELKTFQSAEEVMSHIGSGSMYSSRSMFGGAMELATADFAPSASDSVKESYSETNVQVAGVDEADFVKNDGTYIYTLTGNTLAIVKGYPEGKVVSETDIQGYPNDLFISGDRLVVFHTKNEEYPVISPYDFVPREQWTTVSYVTIYDITDRSNPRKVQDYSIKGNHITSRMIDDHVYFVVQEYPDYWGGPIIDLPIVRAGERTILEPAIHYFDNAEYDYVFTTVASFNIQKDGIQAETYLLGYSSTIYVSPEAIYISYQKNVPYTQESQKTRFFSAVAPHLPITVSETEDWDSIRAKLEEMYNRMESEERRTLVSKIEKSLEEYDARLEAERRKTVIHKILIDDGNIDYDIRGEVPGYLLNQFSMDEHDGNLRVATTTTIWSARREMYNNVFVLDRDLEIIGKIEDIAPDERIYSTRFMGDRLYMVTFMEIDPFFVIDLSDPRQPYILGELKIPGYSDYLHPYDDNHIIGIGKETEAEKGRVTTMGVKLALFDVSDVNNPKQVARYEIGTSGTDSEALRDHKAFLFDRELDLLIIPVREIKGERFYDERLHYYRQDSWQGAYVFSLTPEEGFRVKGKISHSDGTERSDHWYSSPSAVRRALYMGDVLYTVSSQKIAMNDLETIEDLGTISLPYTEEQYYRPWY